VLTFDTTPHAKEDLAAQIPDLHRPCSLTSTPRNHPCKAISAPFFRLCDAPKRCSFDNEPGISHVPLHTFFVSKAFIISRPKMSKQSKHTPANIGFREIRVTPCLWTSGMMNLFVTLKIVVKRPRASIPRILS